LLTVREIKLYVLGDLALPGSETIHMAVSGGSLFSLLVLIVAAQLAGWLVSLLHVPPLLGMLLAGILLQNLPGVGSTLGQSD
jgi:ABC-type uncharacterized transport system permease subunit